MVPVKARGWVRVVAKGRAAAVDQLAGQVGGLGIGVYRSLAILYLRHGVLGKRSLPKTSTEKYICAADILERRK